MVRQLKTMERARTVKVTTIAPPAAAGGEMPSWTWRKTNVTAPATAAAARRQAWLRTKVGSVRVVQASSPRGIGSDDISRALGVDVIASIPHVPSMTVRADEGDLPSLPRAYAVACDAILESLGTGELRKFGRPAA